MNTLLTNARFKYLQDESGVDRTATLIIRHPENDKLYVNFDREILQLIRETKCLQRIEVEVLDGAKMVLLQEDKFKTYYNQLCFVLKEYDCGWLLYTCSGSLYHDSPWYLRLAC